MHQYLKLYVKMLIPIYIFLLNNFICTFSYNSNIDVYKLYQSS